MIYFPASQGQETCSKPRIVGASEHRKQMKKQFKSASFVSDMLQRLNFTRFCSLKTPGSTFFFLKSSFAAKIGPLIYTQVTVQVDIVLGVNKNYMDLGIT